MTITTITRLKQLRDHLAGKLMPQRVERKRQEQECAAEIAELSGASPRLLSAAAVLNAAFEKRIVLKEFDRFASFRDKIVPKLRDGGYGYFLSCDSKQYQEHQEWCNNNCQDHCLPWCDVWQCDSKYPRAFANKTDAALFRIMFDAVQIEGDK